jgi:hypothetical protein
MKTCSKCSEQKPFSEFSKKGKSTKGTQLYRADCAKCVSDANKLKYNSDENLRKRAADNAKALVLRRRIFVFDYLKSHPCVDCGNSDIRVLEFDHVRGDKVMGVAQLTSRKRKLETIKAEMDKCEIRCANCHRIVTATRGNWMVNMFHDSSVV